MSNAVGQAVNQTPSAGYTNKLTNTEKAPGGPESSRAPPRKKFLLEALARATHGTFVEQ